MSLVDWGDVPTWIGGAGALAAGWFAYQTIKSQRQQIGEQQEFIAEQSRFMDEQRQNLALERAELRAAADDRKWAQARQVAMAHIKTGGGDDGGGGLTAYDHWSVTVVNHSDAPLHDLQVRFGTAYLAVEAWEWRSAGRIRGDRQTVPMYLLGPGRSANFLSQRFQEATVDNNRPVLTFTDDNGVRWSLDSYGKLEEVPADGTS